MIGHYVLRSTVKKVSTAKWFSLLADETRDVSNREQLTIRLRWEDENFDINEDYWTSQTDRYQSFNSQTDRYQSFNNILFH